MLLSWHRDVDIPNQYSYESGANNLASTVALRDWQHAVTALHERALRKQDCVELGLISKIKSSQVLRTYPADGFAWIGMKVYDAIIYMIWADIATEDLVPAGVHLQMLSQLIKIHTSPEAFDPWWGARLMWADLEYAAMQLSRPLLDIDQWSFETHYTNWIEESKFEEYWDFNLHLFLLDDSISDEALKPVFRDLEKLVAVENFHTLNPPPATCSIFRWMRARKIRCESQLLSMYADAFSLTKNKDLPPGANDHLVKECTWLAATSWVAISFDYVGESKKTLQHVVQRKYGLFLSRLRETIIRCSDLLPPRLRLWILFVGAVLEQCVGERVQRSNLR